jgi:hypothetical protein
MTTFLYCKLIDPGNQITVFDMQPLPKANRTKQSRQVQCASVITSSPVKIELLKTEKKKAEKEKRKAERSSNRLVKKQKFVASEAKVSQVGGPQYSASTLKDCKIRCPACDDLYSHPPEEDWIQCSTCLEWWHEICSNFEGGRFVCDYCQ